MKFRCIVGIHKWIVGVGWSGNRWSDNAQRFDSCSCCNKTRWVDDQKGYDNMIKEMEYWSSKSGIREKRLSKILDK
ncbi:MAG: hypothetical protein SLAVMIC_00975 [uncultured marine phage]|uniref:Uncharacterized protein n=1 Tax=uncultured marine phage TaxID=707152 RepID=A0A8D9CG24_9VIRU|nr:MAG: hypothetical protein SLAVMIC_00975 [uncultured marine phage]